MKTTDGDSDDRSGGVSGRQARRARIIDGLQGRELHHAVFDRRLWDDLKEEAGSGGEDPLVTPDAIEAIEQAQAKRLNGASLSVFFSTDDVIIVPGFLGSELVDVSGGNGLIWIDPKLLRGDTSDVDALRLKAYERGAPESDEGPVTIRANGAIPLVYSVLKFDLEVRRYSVRIFGVDWRKDLEEASVSLAEVIKARTDQRFRPLHLIADSQGALVARRAIQLLGAELAPGLVKTLVLLAPATAGTFSAMAALTGNYGLIEVLRRTGIELPRGFERTIQSMSGVYQLLPWRTEPTANRTMNATMNRPIDWVKRHAKEITTRAFWPNGIDEGRLREFFGWGDKIESGFFNDRTTIILGDRPTVGGVKRLGKWFVADPDYDTTGDGVMPDALALVVGVTRVYKAAGAHHMMLPATLEVIAAVRDILADRSPRVVPFDPGGVGGPGTPFPVLARPSPEAAGRPKKARSLSARGKASAKATISGASAFSAVAVGPDSLRAPRMAGDIFPPASRRLRVFSFDPLMANELDALGTEQITLELPWDFADGNQLQPGPVGEYLEVIDCDPASGCVYPPIDLNHPHVLAQDGIPVSEGDPRFHQQMTYAVAMNTIHHFEQALGRKALWSPYLRRDAAGKVIPHPEGMSFEQEAESEFVQRLRIYPHAFRQANAYYNPEKKALLFGYFPAIGTEGDRNLPGGTVFTCLSHDVIAHETTHALLDGMHRYFVEPSNPDVFAFHEAFADIVALFQHFTHRDVLLAELGKARGDVGNRSKLGILAAQFGEATGHRGALRQYLGARDEKTGKWGPIEPDPSAIRRVAEPHGRGALLVAALFRAFTNIYENRVSDLRRIATGGTGLLPEGALHPDLVARMADEASKSAEHMLNICIRALDYVPPVDISFGVYLRAMITADHDLIPEDARRYRAAIVSAFRDWGIYPSDVRSLSVDNLLWSEPSIGAHPDLRDFLKTISPEDWDLGSDRRRAFDRMKRNAMLFHRWLTNSRTVADVEVESLGLSFDTKSESRSIRRDSRGKPVFEVHSFRPCRRIGPDRQQRTEFVVEIVQKRMGFFDEQVQADVDSGKVPADSRPADFSFRGGCTLLIDPREGRIRYCIQKPICDQNRLALERKFRLGEAGDGVGGLYIDGAARPRNPFAFLHGGH